MVGFIKKLFGSKSDNNEEQSNRQQAFFLDPDEAKTLGDIEFMRQPNTSKKSFPKTLNNPEGGEMVEEVSALEKKSISKSESSQNNTNQQSQSSQQVTPENPAPSANNDPAVEQRRQSDSSLDMFRNMARDIKKE